MPLTQKDLPSLIAGSNELAKQGMSDQAKMALEQYLKGKLGPNGEYTGGVEHAAEEAKTQSLVQHTRDLEADYMKKHPGFKGTFRVGPNGVEISENQQYPTGALANEHFLDKQAEAIADKTQKAGIPQIQAQTDLIKSDMAKGGGHLQSVGGLKNAVPDAFVPIAEGIGKIGIPGIGMPEGSTLERQHLAGAKNAAMHAQFGSRQTDAEKAMLADQLGVHFGTSPENVEKGIAGLADVADREGKNIISGVNPAAAQRYAKRGGNARVTPITNPAAGPRTMHALLGATPPAQAAEVDPIEAELAKRSGGK